MKRTIPILLMLLVLCACKKEQTHTASVEELGGAVCAAAEAYAFERADADFVETGFDAPAALAESAVYFASDPSDTCEFGIFCLTDAAHAGEMERAIRSYLENERSAVESLAALYPGDELKTRLARYRDALVGTSGNIVYYFVMDPQTASGARDALLSALQ